MLMLNLHYPEEMNMIINIGSVILDNSNKQKYFCSEISSNDECIFYSFNAIENDMEKIFISKDQFLKNKDKYILLSETINIENFFNSDVWRFNKSANGKLVQLEDLVEFTPEFFKEKDFSWVYESLKDNNKLIIAQIICYCDQLTIDNLLKPKHNNCFYPYVKLNYLNGNPFHGFWRVEHLNIISR